MKKLLLICVLMIPLLMLNPASAIPGIPHQFYGDVYVNGNPAADGTVIIAFIAGTEVASTTTSGGDYNLIVPDPLGDRSGDIITFSAAGKDTGKTAVFQNAKNEQIDFSVTTSTGSTPSSGGGGGGGGGGGSYVPPGTTEDDTTADNGDSGTETPPIPQPINQPTEGAESTGAQVEETETTTDTGEQTIVSRITGAFAGTFSKAENAMVGLLTIVLLVIAGWFASKKFKKKKTSESEEK